MAAFGLIGILCVLAISLECGGLLVERRHAQAIADSSAMAAACDLTYNFGFNNGLDPQGSARASALATAATLGYANDGTSTTVTVNIPPLSGDHAGVPGYAEVIATYSQPRSFSSLFGTSASSVSARSIARGQWQTTAIGLLALEPYLPASLTIALNSTVQVPNASVVVDSSSFLSTAVALNGSLTTPTFNMTGGYLALLNGSINAKIQTGVAPTPRPFELSLPARSIDPCVPAEFAPHHRRCADDDPPARPIQRWYPNSRECQCHPGSWCLLHGRRWI